MNTSTPSFDSTFFRSALGRFATGVTVVTTCANEATKQNEPASPYVGLTVSSFNSVSLNPPLVLWSLSRTSSSLATLERAERYVIQVMTSHQMVLANKFARGTPSEKFSGVAVKQAPGGTPMLGDETAAWFECINRSRYDEGDHIIFIGEVQHCSHSDAMPLIYHAGGYDLTPTGNLAS
jgi:flavin reductase (DIM6/NTAB) family NADH-FMN oxidoreductase RutF